MPVVITVTGTSQTTWQATFSITGLDTAKRYDIVRVTESSDDNERKYQLVGTYRDWQPGSTSVSITDTEAAVRPFRLAVWDSTGVTPLDFDFATGGYTGPAALAESSTVSLLPPQCGALIRSTKVPGFAVDARIWDVSPVEYRAKASELTPMGTRYPVIIADRREGRRIDRLTLYAPDGAKAKELTDLLLPENGRIYPLWMRTAEDNKLLFHDLLFMPMDVTIEPVSKARPQAKFFVVNVVEIDPRLMPGGVV